MGATQMTSYSGSQLASPAAAQSKSQAPPVPTVHKKPR